MKTIIYKKDHDDLDIIYHDKNVYYNLDNIHFMLRVKKNILYFGGFPENANYFCDCNGVNHE